MLRRSLVLVVALAVSPACGGDEPPAAQPMPDEATFHRGAFDDLPRYPRSEPIGELTEKDGVVARSFEATGATPQAVVAWYRDNLRGWQLDQPPAPIGEETYRGRWSRAELFLVVSATGAPTLSGDGDDGVSSQYSLSLEPR